MMSRPRKIRLVQGDAVVRYYKPQGVPLSDLVETVLSLDGLEALRLADVERLEQADAATRMGISRSTFSRLLSEARSAVGAALCQGWAIRIDGGPVETASAGEGRAPCIRSWADWRDEAKPAADAADAEAKEELNMTWIAVSAKGTTPDAAVDARFGRAEGFVLFDPETRCWSYLSNGEAIAQASGAGVAAVERLAKAKVTVVYSGSIGPKAARALAAAGITGVEGAAGKTVREALGAAYDLSAPGEAR